VLDRAPKLHPNGDHRMMRLHTSGLRLPSSPIIGMRIVACEVGDSTCPEPGHMNIDEDTIYVRAEDIDAFTQILGERS